MSGKLLAAMMRQDNITIRELARAVNVTLKTVRVARNAAEVANPLDWLDCLKITLRKRKEQP